MRIKHEILTSLYNPSIESNSLAFLCDLQIPDRTHKTDKSQLSLYKYHPKVDPQLRQKSLSHPIMLSPYMSIKIENIMVEVQAFI